MVSSKALSRKAPFIPITEEEEETLGFKSDPEEELELENKPARNTIKEISQLTLEQGSLSRKGLKTRVGRNVLPSHVSAICSFQRLLKWALVKHKFHLELHLGKKCSIFDWIVRVQLHARIHLIKVEHAFFGEP